MFRKSLVFLGVALLGTSLLAGCGGSANPVSVTVETTAASVDATDSVNLTATVANDKTSAGVSWTVSGGGALSNETTSSAVYTAPAASSSPLTVTATATSIGDPTKTGSITLTVPAAPSITTTADQLASTVGAAYSVTLAGSGGIAPYTWTATGLPSCLTLNKNGVLSGTIMASCAGATTPTFTLTDSGTATALTASAQINLVIAAAPAISFTGSTSLAGAYNTAYTGSTAASGGAAGSALTYSEVGTWPSWLSLNSTTGAVSGTPAAVGSYSFSVQAADPYGDTATQAYTMTVGRATPTIGISNLPSSGVYGGGFTATFANSGNGAVTLVSNSGNVCTVNGSAVSYVGVGSCSLTASTAVTTDYAAAASTVAFQVNPATPSITTQPAASAITYGNALSASTLSGGVGSVNGTFAWTAPNTVPTAGSQTEGFTFTPGNATDYTTVTGTASVVVNKAALTVTASSSSVNYGAAVPAITPSYAGFVNGDSSSSLTTAPSCTTTYTTTSAFGSYPTSCSGAVDGNYAFTYVSGAVSVGKATPTISTQPTATGISYGSALSASTLSGGVASVAGTFAWTTPATVPAAGSQTEGYTFTPTDTTDYNNVTGTASVTVGKAAPSVSAWPTAGGITYGQTLAASTLTGGTSSVAGSFAWTTGSTTPGAGTALYGVTFTPTDSADYNTLAGTVSVVVAKAASTVSTWPTASGITSGQTLASSTLSGGSSTPAGSFAWTTSSTVPALGTSSNGVTFTPTDATDYTSLTGSVSVTVSKGTPTITSQPTATAISYGSALSASTLSGGVASVAGTFAWTTPATVPAIGAQTEGYTFTPTDSTNYNNVTGTVSVTVSKAAPSVSAWPTAGGITYGQTLAASILTGGTSSVAGSFAWTTGGTTPGAGTALYGVTFTPTNTADYSTVTGTVSLVVAKATSTVSAWPTASGITSGQTLASSTLSGGSSIPAGSFAWTTSSTVPALGTSSNGVTFTPTDATDYTSLTGSVSVTVSKGTPTITSQPSATAISYGSALSASTLSGGVASVAGTFAWTTPATVPAIGAQTEGYTFTPTDSADYNNVTGTVSVTVNKAAPSVSAWPTAGSITYGQTLAASILTGGTSSVAGSFAWTLGSTVPAAGAPSYSVTFTPTNTTDYTTVVNTISVVVNPATLTVTASSPTVLVGSAVPTITPSYSGFQNGDTVAVVTVAPTCSTKYTPSSTVGSAPSTSCSGGVVSSNYVFNYVSGVVNVVAMSITTSPTLPTGYVNSSYPQTTLTVIGGAPAYLWAVTSGNPPTGLTLNSTTGVISGTPIGPAGTTNFTVSVTDSLSNTAQVQFSVTIDAGVTITTASQLPVGLQGTAYSGQTVSATGGTGSYSWTWAAASGSSIPSGMSINHSTGAISGTPGASGSFSIVVTATDTASNTASRTFSLTVDSPLSISTASLPGGVANTAYAGTSLVATGGSGNYSWSWAAASGSSLPAGITFSGGLLAGTPTTHGNYSVVFTVKDTTLNVTSSATLVIAIAYAPLSITTTTVPSATVNTAYTSTQFAATGGSGSYTWSWVAASGSSLPAGMSFSTSGLLSGTPTALGRYMVQVTVTDATANSNTTGSFTINVDSAGFSITTAPTLPIEYVNSSYSTLLRASGGTGTLTWTMVSGSMPTGLSLIGSQIIGKPTVTGSFTFTIKVTDSASDQASQTFSLTVVPVLSITSTSPLTSGIVGNAYSQSLTATGGSGSYSWSWAAASGSLPANLAISSSTGLISGTPSAAGSYSIIVTVSDTVVTGKSASATFTLPIASPGVTISGQISLLNNCAGATSVPSIAVTLTSNTQGSSFQPLTSITSNNGSYSFNNIPPDNYTITPVVSTPSSGVAPSSVFYPATQSITVNTGNLSGENFFVALGYSVSGSVTYSGAQTSGQIYLTLSASGCGNQGSLGTSISYPFTSGGSFTINGVPPGTYALNTWMDNRGNGDPNVVNPTGSVSGISVINDRVSNSTITLNDPSITAVSGSTSGPSLNFVSPTDQGVAISFSPITNSSNVEAVTSYEVQWSTTSSFTGTPSSYTFSANGGQGAWILNNGLKNFTGSLVNNTAYYFRACGILSGNQTAWSSTVGPITVGAPAGDASTSNIGGTVSLPTVNTSTNTAITSYGPLYVGFYDQGTGAIYADRIASPSSPQEYSVNVPDGDNYIFFAILDQNNDGLIDTGDITNINGGYSTPIGISGDDTLSQYDLAAYDSSAVATTQMTQFTDIHGNSTTSYGVDLELLGGVKLPVAVELTGPSYSYLIAPVDLSACTSCGNVQFDYQPSIAGAVPTANDNFPLQVTYGDGTTDPAVYATVTGVGATATDPNTGVQTTVAASGLELSGADTQPNFGWTDPNNAGNYTYSFTLTDSNGNVIWQVPSNNSHVSGFDSSITLISWGSDPTGNISNTPKVSSLTTGSLYTWSVEVVDSNGNSSQTQVSFQP